MHPAIDDGANDEGLALRDLYVREWWHELEARGITPNGTTQEQRVARALLRWKAPNHSPKGWKASLRSSARALKRAQKRGPVFVEPSPFGGDQ